MLHCIYNVFEHKNFRSLAHCIIVYVTFNLVVMDYYEYKCRDSLNLGREIQISALRLLRVGVPTVVHSFVQWETSGHLSSTALPKESTVFQQIRLLLLFQNQGKGKGSKYNNSSELIKTRNMTNLINGGREMEKAWRYKLKLIEECSDNILIESQS